MKFSIKDFFNKCDQIRRKLKKFLMENFVFCAVTIIVWKIEQRKSQNLENSDFNGQLIENQTFS